MVELLLSYLYIFFRLLLCRYKIKGCNFKTSKEEGATLIRHITWFCSYNSFYCSTCINGIIHNNRQMDHTITAHALKLKCTTMDKFSVVYITYLPRKWRIVSGSFLYTVNTFNVNFLFEISLSNDLISIWLIADTEDFSYKYYVCMYEFLNVRANNGVLLEKCINYLGKYDWFSSVKISGPIPNEIKMKFFIKEKNND